LRDRRPWKRRRHGPDPDASAGNELAPIHVFLRQFLGPVALIWKRHSPQSRSCVPLSWRNRTPELDVEHIPSGLGPIAEFDRAALDL